LTSAVDGGERTEQRELNQFKISYNSLVITDANKLHEHGPI